MMILVFYEVAIPRVLWTAGIYNEVDKKFYWYKLLENIKFLDGPAFNYTNWANGDPRHDMVLTGNEMVILITAAKRPADGR